MPVIALTITDDGHNFIRDTATGADQWTNIYFSLSSDTSTPASTDHTINEVFRKLVTIAVNGPSVGEVLFNCFVSDSDAVGVNIQKVGVFVGLTASSSSNSGKMLGSGLWAHNPKTSTESLQVQLDLQ